MLEQAEKALEVFPDQSSVYLFYGVALSQNERHEEAVKILKSGSKLVVDDDNSLFSFYSSLGDSYNELKNYVESDKYFDKALEIDPKEPFLLNNYSYYLSVRGVDLEKAEKMSKLSNELQPGQASFQDTYAWILYRIGKYEEAKLWLEKALKSGGDTSGTILEHYGDVLYQLGNTDEALQYWIKAKDIGDVSDLIDQKIKDKKLYE
jgi:tetratricopeptide (TPR) repeat protein